MTESVTHESADRLNSARPIGGREFFSGEFFGRRSIAAFAGVGKVAAAITATTDDPHVRRFRNWCSLVWPAGWRMAVMRAT
jgi:hypothetical protein